MHEPEHTDPQDEGLSDSPPDFPSEDSTDANIDGFDVDMPEFEEFADNNQPQMDVFPDESLDDSQSTMHDIESEALGNKKVSARSKGSISPKRRIWAASLGIAAALAMIAGSTVHFRKEVCAYMPALAVVYNSIGLPVNLIGMDFAGIELKRKYENGFPVLSVHGEIVNISGQVRQVPDIRIGLQGPGGYEVYHWSINIGQATLKPDERVKFVTRLASPPEEARKITIKFKKLRDRQMGAL